MMICRCKSLVTAVFFFVFIAGSSPAFGQDVPDLEVSVDEELGVERFFYESISTERDVTDEEQAITLRIEGKRDLCWRPDNHERRQIKVEASLLGGDRDHSYRQIYTQYAERMDDDVDADFHTLDGLPMGMTQRQWYIDGELVMEIATDQVKPLAMKATQHATYIDPDIRLNDDDFEMQDILWRMAYVIAWARVSYWAEADDYCLRCDDIADDVVELRKEEEHELQLRITDWKGDELEGVELAPRNVRLGAMSPEDAVADEHGQAVFTYMAKESGLDRPLLRMEYSFYNSGERIASFQVSGQHALVEGEISMEGITSTGRMYSCDGIGGMWYSDWELTVNTPEMQGTIGGGGSFKFPDEPVPGDRESLTVDMSGKLEAEDGTVEFDGVWEYTVVLLEENDRFLLGGEGDVFSGSMHTTVPELGTITIPMSMPIEFGDPRPIEFVDHLEDCEELPLERLEP